MDETRAREEIEKKLDEARKLIEEAEAIADEAGVTFSFDLAYGMGGTYYPDKVAEERGYVEEEDLDNGWRASSRSC